MNLQSYAKKLISLIGVRFLEEGSTILPNLYLLNMHVSELSNVKSILFYFNDDEYMHLGDHLFFIPLIKTFVDNGYNVKIVPTKAMRPLFRELSLPVIERELNFTNYDLIVTRVEMISQFSKYKTILVDVSKDLTQPICDQLISDFSNFFNLNSRPIIEYTQFKDSRILTRLGLPHYKKIIIINYFCNASAFMINQAKVNCLADLAAKYAADPEYLLVLVGAADDQSSDDFDVPYIDLRGKTTVLDMFSLVNCENVAFYIGFDAFVMHIFSLLHKPSYVVFRGRLLKRQHDMLMKYHVNLFNNHNFVTLLEHKTR